MQPNRLSYDHPYQGQKTTTVATNLFFGHHVKIQFPQITAF